jgi:hypothetical protein
VVWLSPALPTHPCNKTEHLMLWGWRVPFLLTLFTAPIAYIMRMHM